MNDQIRRRLVGALSAIAMLLLSCPQSVEAQWLKVEGFDQLALVLASDDSALYAGSGRGLYRSTDMGDTWTRLYAASGSDDYPVDILAQGDTLVIRIWNGGTLVSTDGGGTWADRSTAGHMTILGSARFLFGYLFVTASNGVFRSSDLGLTWESRSAGLRDSDPSIALARYGRFLYAGGLAGVYRSEDTGATWTRTSAGMTSAADVYGFAVTADRIHAATHDGIWTSADSGMSWTRDNAAILAADPIVTDGDTVYAGTTWGPFRTTDKGASWESLRADGSFNAVNALTIHRGWIFAMSSTPFAAEDRAIWKRSVMSLSAVEEPTFGGERGIAVDALERIIHVRGVAGSPLFCRVIDPLGRMVAEVASDDGSSVLTVRAAGVYIVDARQGRERRVTKVLVAE